MKRKNKKKVAIWSVVGVLIILIAASLLFTQKGNAYEAEEVQKGDISTYYSFSGTVDAKSRQNVVSMKEKHVEEVLVKAGDQVKKNDVLLINSDGEETRAEIDGEISKLNVKSNSHVLKGSQLMDIINYSDLHVSVKVDEYDLKYVEVGQQVDVTLNALEKVVKGKVYSISKEAVNENGISYFTALIEVDKDETIRIGMSAESRILKDSAKDVPTLSMKALQFDSKNKPYVMLAADKGESVKRYVEIGINDGTIVEIKDGVDLGDKILVLEKATPASDAAMMHGGGAE